MSTTPKKKKVDDGVEETETSGYINSVSPIHTSRNNNRYFNAVLQTKEGYTSVVSFNMGAHTRMMEMEKERSPVTLQDVQKVPSIRTACQFDLKMSSKSSINMPRKKLDFLAIMPSSTQAQEVKVPVDMSTEDVKTVASVFDKVNLIVKVLDVFPTEAVSNALTKMETVVADKEGVINLTVWNDQIPLLEKGATYNIRNVTVREYDEVRHLSCNKESSIIIADALQNTKELSQTTTKFEVMGVAAVECTVCQLCFKDIGQYDKEKPTIKCTHCQQKQKTTQLKRSVNVNITTTERVKLIIRHNVLAKYEEVNFLEKSPQEIEDIFLEKGTFNGVIQNNTVVCLK